MKKDRIEQTYEAIDEMIDAHGSQKPDFHGGGIWDAEEEFKIYKKQVGDRYSPLQWKIIQNYFDKEFEKKIGVKRKKNVFVIDEDKIEEIKETIEQAYKDGFQEGVDATYNKIKKIEKENE